MRVWACVCYIMLSIIGKGREIFNFLMTGQGLDQAKENKEEEKNGFGTKLKFQIGADFILNKA